MLAPWPRGVAGLEHVAGIGVAVAVDEVDGAGEPLVVGGAHGDGAGVDQALAQDAGLGQRGDVAVALLDRGVGATTAHRGVEDGAGALGEDAGPGVDVGAGGRGWGRCRVRDRRVVVDDGGSGIDGGDGIDHDLVDGTGDLGVARTCWSRR